MTEAQSAVKRFIDQSLDLVLAHSGPALKSVTTSPARTGPLDVVIPIFNHAALLQRCLDSLLPTLSQGDRVWLIDDASDEAAVPEVMQAFSEGWPETRLLSNPRNLGFVGNSNRAFALTHHDMVLLNSDTEVSTGWLEQMQACLERNERAGIVCPLSDQATLLSVLPQAGTVAQDEIARDAARTGAGDPLLPTAVGFCMLIRRPLIREIGVFSQLFAPGYGEENDLSMRALRAGWDIVAADQAAVFHRSQGSFGQAESRRLQERHQAVLDRIWPEYGPLVRCWWRDNPLRSKTERLAWHDDERDGILHLLHRKYHVGGTERVTRSLIRALGDRYRQTLIYQGETRNGWCDAELRSADLCRELMLNKRWIRPNTVIGGHGADLGCAQSERTLARVLVGMRPGIVHFHHMLRWDSLLLPALAKRLGCRVVISVHDFWFNCPIHNQLEHSTGQPCGRPRAQADERCGQCLRAYGEKGLDAKNNAAATYADGRHALIRNMLNEADIVLVPAKFLRDKLLRAYALDTDEHVRLMPQGVQLPAVAPDPERRPGPCRVVAYFGGDLVLKGAGLVLEMARALVDTDVSFRIYGRIKGFRPESLPANVDLRGYYHPDDIETVMRDIDLGLLPSFYEESFSMIASECWAHNIPVLASSRGALRERVIEGVNGWLVKDMDAASWISRLQEVLQGDTLADCRRRLAQFPVTSIEESAAEIEQLYQRLLRQPHPQTAYVGTGTSSPAFSAALDEFRSAALVMPKNPGWRCLGVLRDHWGTPNYRVRLPLQDLARSEICESSHFHVVRDSGFRLSEALEGSDARRIVIQPFLSDEGLALMEYLHRESGFEVILSIDDLWTAIPADNPLHARLPPNVPERLRYAASLSHTVVLTTAELRRQLDLQHDNVHVIDNALPEWVWGKLAGAGKQKRKRLRIGWSGAPQHGPDLAFLEPVMKNTADLADWVFLGMCPDHLRPLAGEVHGMVAFDDYPGALAGLDLDLAIAPLTTHDFNRCKSHLKVLEYGILGLPVIAADLEPYRDCPVSLAAPDQAEEWTRKIRDLLESPEARVSQGASLRQWVLQNHLTEHRRPDWQAALDMNHGAC